MALQIKLLDATLRDGGLGLEDAWENNFSDDLFDEPTIKKIINLLKESKVDIIELGTIEISDDDKRQFAIYQNIETISAMIPADRQPGQMCVGMYRGPDASIGDIPEWTPGLCEGVRVILRYSELQKSLDFCAALSRKGYKVFVQPMLTMRYTDEEIDRVIKAANDMNAYALYFVDSYGYMQEEDVQRFVETYDKFLDSDISIGFHAHNNMNLAYANVLHFLNSGIERNLVVDACVTGMGQGAGNLQTELIVPYLNDIDRVLYDYDSILDICEIMDGYINHNIWGYSVVRLLPAIHKVAYKYALVLRHKYKLSYKEINRVFSKMPDDLRHRYTSQNVEKLLRGVR